VSGTYSTDGDALELRFDDYGETWVYGESADSTD
jgi:hypothetical protein